MLLIFKALYFFLPAYLANMAPVFVRNSPFLKTPVHKKLFGKNKTWRGMVVAVLTGTLIFSIQKFLHAKGFQSFSIINYDDFTIALGFLLGLGAISGDLLESYYKRKKKIKAGKPWLFWDQMDFVLGGIILSLIVYVPPAEVVLTIIIASPLLHFLVNYIGYLLKIRKNKF